eukprot:TRINITY_DN5049_c0_g1_i2.p1 TRINITY_DN5049_c0_g1~~TRINITY_DN5049_c0_g1_i2.p1  ORF type:complete len:136 (+),score=55.62 TRINITY_DN5049_c0_g1_i2:80-487(+)
MSTQFLIDEIDLYAALGNETIINLSTKFYDRVYSDTDNEFLSIFPPGEQSKKQAIQNQYEFLIQRFGGPPLYSDRKGHPALKARHHKFAITTKAADRWLMHMNAAINDVGIKGQIQQALIQFFSHVAYFLRNTDD